MYNVIKEIILKDLTYTIITYSYKVLRGFSNVNLFGIPTRTLILNTNSK